jgi:histone H3/H4
MQQRLNELVRELESESVAQDAERKTLGDPSRTRLGFNRTRGLIIDAAAEHESVGAAAVVRINEELESFVAATLRNAGEAAAIERVGTIKPRHLEKALAVSDLHPGTGQAADSVENAITSADPLDEALQGGAHGVLTAATVRRLAKSFARGMRIDEAAIEELILLYYDHAAEVQSEATRNLTGSNPHLILQTLNKFDSLAQMGWMKRMLSTACQRAEQRGDRIIRIDHIVELDPWD